MRTFFYWFASFVVISASIMFGLTAPQESVLWVAFLLGVIQLGIWISFWKGTK